MKYDKSNKTEHDIKKDGLSPSILSGGKSAEDVRIAADKWFSTTEWIDADKNSFAAGAKWMQEQYTPQQPVNDGWVRVDSGELPDYRLVVDVYKSHHNVVEPAARLSTDITGEKWSCEYGHYITHWRLRPEPPKQ